jgi:hypothetical protein
VQSRALDGECERGRGADLYGQGWRGVNGGREAVEEVAVVGSVGIKVNGDIGY